MRTHPSLSSPQPADETPQERLLRDTFNQHADIPIDVGQAWMQVAQRLPAFHRQAKQAGRVYFPSWLSGKQPRQARMRGIPLVATLALITVLLMGAGVAAGVTSSRWPIPLQQFLTSLSQHVPVGQFQVIGQQVQSNGVTITLESAYAGADRTIIAFTVQLSPDLKKDSWGALPASFDFVVNGQKETLTGKDFSMCIMNVGKEHSEYCVWVLTPMHVSSSTKQLNVTWDFTTITLKKLLPANTYEAYTGQWSFHFTLPFHQQSHDPGMPPTPAN